MAAMPNAASNSPLTKARHILTAIARAARPPKQKAQPGALEALQVSTAQSYSPCASTLLLPRRTGMLSITADER